MRCRLSREACGPTPSELIVPNAASMNSRMRMLEWRRVFRSMVTGAPKGLPRKRVRCAARSCTAKAFVANRRGRARDRAAAGRCGLCLPSCLTGHQRTGTPRDRTASTLPRRPQPSVQACWDPSVASPKPTPRHLHPGGCTHRATSLRAPPARRRGAPSSTSQVTSRPGRCPARSIGVPACGTHSRNKLVSQQRQAPAHFMTLRAIRPTSRLTRLPALRAHSHRWPVATATASRNENFAYRLRDGGV